VTLASESVASESAGTTVESRELEATDLSAARSVARATGDHVEDDLIEATGFPGLLGNTLGLRLDVPVYVATPTNATVALARLTLEAGFGPFFGLVGAVDFNNEAFGVGLSMNLPGYVPLSRQIAIALQPRLQGIVYYATASGLILTLELTLRVGYSPIPHLVIAAEVGAVVAGVIRLESRSLVEGVYAGPMFGGGVEWAFY
jgi:hypothetical protein